VLEELRRRVPTGNPKPVAGVRVAGWKQQDQSGDP
jgi:hypothetical protein